MNQDTIIARSTPPGKSAIALVRLSGNDVLAVIKSHFSPLDSNKIKTRYAYFGQLTDRDGMAIDEVVLIYFRGPGSYTGEDVIEISCHGSDYVVQRIIESLIDSGARPAGPGEFTLRAFLNGKLDLAQAEGVIDLIESENKAQHQLAIQQVRGGFSRRISELREKLIHFASLIELELDFGEEDVEFAKRDELKELVVETNAFIEKLVNSFSMGNAVKTGISTVIAGRPNAGKSTLLNALLEEERAIVSNIEGTTRDTIEEVIHLGGLAFRLIDTAGIREAGDVIEEMGIKKTMEKIHQSAILLYIFDMSAMQPSEVLRDVNSVKKEGLQIFIIGNKSDKVDDSIMKEFEKEISPHHSFFSLSALRNDGTEILINALENSFIGLDEIRGDNILHNSRHFNALTKTKNALDKVIFGLEEGIPSDLVAMDIRHGMQALGEILGDEITTEDLLGKIFSRFCIGK